MKEQLMGRVVRVMLGLVIGGCVMLAVLTGLFAQFFTGGALRPSVAKGQEYAAEATGPADSMNAMVEALEVVRGEIYAVDCRLSTRVSLATTPGSCHLSTE
ncbi:MAG: hypothetical protein IH877_08160 [Gemmatimonadetes bacterium]|nr:hypothetical protein [Gemmatimonadota bacterium]